MKKITLILKRVFEKGRICFLLPTDPALLAECKDVLTVCHANHGDYVRVTMQPPYKPRTTGRHSQNSAIHGYCQQIAQAIGEDMEFIKIYAKQLAISRGYPAKRDEAGNVIISPLTDCAIPESTTNINTAEAAILIETIQEIAAEHGIILYGET